MKTMLIPPTSMKMTNHYLINIDMKEFAIAQLLSNCDITESKLVIEVQNSDGARKEITLKDAEDFMNEIVNEGTVINLIFQDGKIYTGIFVSLEDEDGEYILYIRPIANKPMVVCMPYKKLVGYYTDLD